MNLQVWKDESASQQIHRTRFTPAQVLLSLFVTDPELQHMITLAGL